MSRNTNRNRPARPLQEWSGRELLRLFLEQSRMWRAVVQCPECGFEAVLWPDEGGPAIPCIQCGGGVCAPEKAAKPGRPFGARMHYRRAHVYDRLHAARVSSEKIAEILTDPSPKSRQRRYDALPESVHQFLGDFRNQIQSVDYVSGPVELRRSIQWARRQWSSPEFRLTGERVRTRRRARRSARLAGRAIRPAKEMTRPRLGVH